MKTHIKTIIITFLALISLDSCKSKSDSKKNIPTKTEVKKDNKTTEQEITEIEPVIDIKSGDYKIIKNVPKLKTTKDVKPSTKSEIIKMVSNKDISNLNDKQQVMQQFITACASKDYNAASKLLAYNGKDVKRKNNDHYNMGNSNEIQVVKSTVDVIYGFLEESNSYQFLSYKDNGHFSIIEISFFKKALGIDRHYFDVATTAKGDLIVGMR